MAVGAGVAAVTLPPVLVGAGLVLIAGLTHPALMLIITLIVAPLKTLIETEARLSLDLGQIGVGVTFALVGGYWAAVYSKRSRQAWTPQDFLIPACLLVIVITGGLSLWSAVSPSHTVSELIKWIEIIGIATLVAVLCDSKEKRYPYLPILFGILTAGGVQALIGLYQFFGGSGAAHLWILDNRFFRAFGTYGQPNPFGAMMELTLCIAVGATLGIGLEWGVKVWRERRFTPPHPLGLFLSLVAFTGLLAAGLVASWSRGAWIGFGAALAVMILFAPLQRRIGVGLVVGGGMLFIALAITGLLPSSLVARLSDFATDLTGFEEVRGAIISNERYAVLERLAHWQAAFGMMNDHPLTGVGLGNYEVVYPRYALMNWKFALGHAHNYYLNALAETGVIGLAGYLVGWGGIGLLTLRILPRLTGLDRGVALGVLGMQAALATHSLFDKLYVNNLFLQIGAILGLMVTLRRLTAQRGIQ
jgi:O-antigen ligase